MTPKQNLAASVAARLLNLAKQTGDDFQSLLTNYCIERFLYRLAESDQRHGFVLKGAMLLRVWSDRPYRSTRDLDLLHRSGGDFEATQASVRSILATQVQPDALIFEANASMSKRFEPKESTSARV